MFHEFSMEFSHETHLGCQASGCANTRADTDALGLNSVLQHEAGEINGCNRMQLDDSTPPVFSLAFWTGILRFFTVYISTQSSHRQCSKSMGWSSFSHHIFPMEIPFKRAILRWVYPQHPQLARKYAKQSSRIWSYLIWYCLTFRFFFIS